MMEQKLRTSALAVLSYIEFDKLRSSKLLIKNRRQRRLWKILSRPYDEFFHELVKKVEERILYGETEEVK